MNTIELKNNFHNLIDSIKNEAILMQFYELMLKAKDSQEGKLWSRLTKEEQKELFLSELESCDENNLIANEQMKTKHKKWL